MWGSAVNAYRNWLAYTVTVSESDHVYASVQAWLRDVLPGERQRFVKLSTRTISRFETPDDEAPLPPLELQFNDTRAQRFMLDGHRVSVRVIRPEAVNPATMSLAPTTIEFTARSKAGQTAVIGQVAAIQARKGARKPVLRIVNQWGSWSSRADLPLRDLGSVVLPAAQKAAIVGDLGAFLDAEDRYVKLALPWHRGYLLHGPPGTGKTSMVKALANEFNLDLWYVAIGDLTKEASLVALLGEVGPRSILLLEDVDTLQITHDRNETSTDAAPPGSSIGLSSLLNALDGVATPHGLITFMTTNHFDRLDPALTRAGRMDRVEEFGYPDATAVADLYLRFYGRPLDVWKLGTELMPFSQAQLSEAFKRRLDDPAGAALAARELMNEGEMS